MHPHKGLTDSGFSQNRKIMVSVYYFDFLPRELHGITREDGPKWDIFITIFWFYLYRQMPHQDSFLPDLE